MDENSLAIRSGRFFTDPRDNFAGHGEKQSIYIREQVGISTKTTGISRPMCNNCVKFYDRYASQTGQIHYTADPENLTIFVPSSERNSGNSIHFRIFW